MTYGQVKDQVLKLLNQYSIAGAEITEFYNNQADYLARIPYLVNDAMMEIATSVRRIPAVLDLSTLVGEEIGNKIRYLLPTDFYQFKTGDTLITIDGKHIHHTNQYMIQGKNYLLIPKYELPEDRSIDYTITYYRYPTLIDPEKPNETDELDNVPETHYAVAYYAARQLALYDDAFEFAALSNAYEDKLNKMIVDMSAEVRPTTDAYHFYI